MGPNRVVQEGTTMTTEQESREFTRSPVHAHVEVCLENGVLVDGEAADISLRGMRFFTEKSLPVGKMVRVRVLLEPGQEQPSLSIGGRIARVEAGGVALEFTGVDADSIEHLRRLITYNATNADQVEEEIAAHLGIERIGGATAHPS
jgi:hypothetical protein